MIVLDASAVVEILIGGPLAEAIGEDLSRRRESVIAPHLLDVEVMSAMRSLVAGQRVDAFRMEQFMDALASMPVERYAHTPLSARVWELRHNFTCYDAVYLALAEATNATLYTCDTKLEKGHRARVVVFS